MNGEYKEKLPSGKGELVVTSYSWSIKYYFPGPDYRYNGTSVHIAGIFVKDYIEGYKKNWNKYLEIKETAGLVNGEIKVQGEMSMTIYVGGCHDGVCIQKYHMPLNTENQIQEVIRDYTWAQTRGESIMQLLKQLSG